MSVPSVLPAKAYQSSLGFQIIANVADKESLTSNVAKVGLSADPAILVVLITSHRIGPFQSPAAHFTFIRPLLPSPAFNCLDAYGSERQEPKHRRITWRKGRSQRCHCCSAPRMNKPCCACRRRTTIELSHSWWIVGRSRSGGCARECSGTNTKARI